MKTMEKQKSKFGIVELMPNGKIFGYVNVSEMSQQREIDIIEDYIDMGYQPVINSYKLAGGNTSTIYYKYIDEDGLPEEGESTHVIHGIFIMKTELKKYVPTQDK
tara:strand:- start:1151 stop:1465 length:315 start_codon:yes stop_codon:yes gene_type:complete